MLEAIFHAWERRLASATTDRVVRPFEWGVDWIPRNGHPPDMAAGDRVREWIDSAMADTDAFFSLEPTGEYVLQPDDGQATLRFPSAIATPHRQNNTVYCQYFPARLKPRAPVGDGARGFSRATGHGGARGFSRATSHDGARGFSRATGHDGARGFSRAAVLVLPQWNSDADGHVGLCRLLAWSGISALRLTLPYHDRRMPPELHRADYIVSANIARTVQVCRQAVLDARRAIHWLSQRGYDRIGILGTSLGSCLALL